MKLLHLKNQYLTRLILAALLFAQGILAAHACIEPVAGAVQALSAQQSIETMHCHESAKVSVNECLIHCTQSDQINLDQHAVAVLPVSDIVLRVARLPLYPQQLNSVYTPLLRNAGPPLSIRFCSFLI